MRQRGEHATYDSLLLYMLHMMTGSLTGGAALSPEAAPVADTMIEADKAIRFGKLDDWKAAIADLERQRGA